MKNNVFKRWNFSGSMKFENAKVFPLKSFILYAIVLTAVMVHDNKFFSFCFAKSNVGLQINTISQHNLLLYSSELP